MASIKKAVGSLLVGLLLLAAAPVFGAAARVQTVTGFNSSSSTTVSATWPDATTEHNLLVACIGSRNRALPSLAGWSDAGVAHDGDITVSILYKEDAGRESGAVTFNLDVSAFATVHLAEYSGVSTALALDQSSGGATGSGTSQSTGTTPSTTAANELLVSCIATGINDGSPGSANYSAPTNSFVEVNEVDTDGITQSNKITSVLHERVVASIGTYSHGVTSAINDIWAGVISTFKEPTAPTSKGLLAND